MKRALAALLAACGFLAFELQAQTYVANLSCTSGPYRLRLSSSYKGLRTLGQLRRERVVRSEEHGTHSVMHRQLRFNGLELEVVTSSDKPNQYALSKAIISTPAWRIAGALRVGSPARVALKGLAKDFPRDGEMEFSGDKDSIRVNLAAGRVLDVEYTCSIE